MLSTRAINSGQYNTPTVPVNWKLTQNSLFFFASFSSKRNKIIQVKQNIQNCETKLIGFRTKSNFVTEKRFRHLAFRSPWAAIALLLCILTNNSDHKALSLAPQFYEIGTHSQVPRPLHLLYFNGGNQCQFYYISIQTRCTSRIVMLLTVRSRSFL